TFVHFASNAARHGFESPADRETLGKPLSGQMKITCSLVSEESRQWLQLEFKDDGQGISVRQLRERLKAMDRPAPKTTPDEELMQVIFEPDFSTAKKVDLIAGRGIGLNAIYESASRLGGSVRVTSERGKGTTFTLRVPYLWDLEATGSPEAKAA
ncbi:MAG: histidine kinase, partial [Bdellovibrionales bacterium]|nr:histidine kinase [Bdellovibrionales bacterium]